MELHSNVMGQGKPFLILHGFLGMSDNWKTIGKKIAEDGYEVHLIDQRNHGKSPHSEDFNYNLMAGDLVEYCRKHDLKNIILMGHSMGGKAAMLFSAQNPDLVEKLIVVDIAPKYYAPHHQEILEGLTALDNADISSRGDAEDFLAKFIKDKGIRLFLLKNLQRESQERFVLKLNLDALKENVEHIGEALPEGLSFDKPALFIKGERSDYILPEDREAILQQFPSAQFAEIPKAGHWVHAENMKAFHEALLKFL